MLQFFRILGYLGLLLTVGLFSYGIYKTTLYLEKKLVPSEESKAEPGDASPLPPKKSYSQYEEVITSRTPSFVKRPPQKKVPLTVSAYPVFHKLTNREGKSIPVTLLGRPDEKTIQFQKRENNIVYTLPLSELTPDDQKYIRTLPVTPAW